MRVGFVSRRFFPAVSGMSVYALNLLEHLVAHDVDVVMVSQYRDDPAGIGVYGGGPPPPVPGVVVDGRASRGEAEVNHGRPADFEADLDDLVSALVEHHRDDPFDVLHAQYAYPCGLAAMEAGRRLGLATVVSIQGGDGHWVGTCCETHRLAMRAVLDHADRLLIGSASFAAEVTENHGTDPERFTIVPGATDTARFTPARDRALASLPPVPRLLFHGRIDRRKGVLDLVEAVAMLTSRGVDVELIVSGVGPDVAATDELVTERGLAERVHRMPPVSYAEAPERYRLGDVFVSPTYSEGFSNTIVEAMASGLPVVSCRAVGVVDCVTDGRNGLLVEPGDIDALAGAIARVLDDDELRRRLAQTALDDVTTTWSWDAVGSTVRATYDELAGSAPDASWTEVYDPATGVADADPSCRFRRSPHLL